MRNAIVLVTVCAVCASTGVAQQSGAAGATDWFGQGIVAVRQSGTELQLDLRTEAQGMVLRLVEHEPITIVAVGPFAAGQSVVRLPPSLGPQRVQVRTDPTTAVPGNPTQTDIAMTAACLHAQGEGSRGPAPARPGTATVNGQPTVTSDICVRTVRTAPTTTTVLRAPPREYLLLVLSDQAPDSTVISRIRSIPGFDPATAAHDLAEYLVGRQSPMWAGYLARR
ncbi:MAG: hypothetical protein ACHQU1_08260 [Gemmatimonadales bacterium]